MLILFLAAAAADTLPPANPLPLADAEEVAVMAPVTALLAALEGDDGAAVRAVTMPEGAATATQTLPNGGVRHKTVPWPEFAAGLKPDGSRIEERLGQPAIEIDGAMAMVWAPYTVRVNGAVDHCGFDHFDLVRVGVAWKVLHATWTVRTDGCAVGTREERP